MTSNLNKPKTIVVIPAFNEEKTWKKIKKKHGKVVVFEGVKKAIEKGIIQDAVVVNDGSIDATSEIARKEGMKVISIKNKNGETKNHGKSGAFLKGLDYCEKNNASEILLLDADLIECKIESIKTLINDLKKSNHLDMLIASTGEGKKPFLGIIHSKHSVISDYISGQRIIRISALKEFKQKLGKDFVRLLHTRFGLETSLNRLFSLMDNPKENKSRWGLHDKLLFWAEPPFRNGEKIQNNDFHLANKRFKKFANKIRRL